MARALVDEPLIADWAAPEALRLLGAPVSPAEGSARLIVVASGPEAERMAAGASAVFGAAVDETLFVPTPTDIAVRLDPLTGSPRRDDRILLLVSVLEPPVDRGPATDVPPGPWSVAPEPPTSPIERFAAWARPAQVVCLALHDPAGLAPDLESDNLDVRVVGERRRGIDAALAEARLRGLDTTRLSENLDGDAAALGRALARVGRAIEAGLGGLRPPACAIACGRVRGGPNRHGAVVAAADEELGAAGLISVECWSPGESAPDLFAVLVAAGRS